MDLPGIEAILTDNNQTHSEGFSQRVSERLHVMTRNLVWFLPNKTFCFLLTLLTTVWSKLGPIAASAAQNWLLITDRK